MPWALIIREAESKRPIILSEEMTIDADDDFYERDVHIVPIFENQDMVIFGPHVFSRECFCQPLVEAPVHGRNPIVHMERVN